MRKNDRKKPKRQASECERAAVSQVAQKPPRRVAADTPRVVIWRVSVWCGQGAARVNASPTAVARRNPG
jgi:hypothetical protein